MGKLRADREAKAEAKRRAETERRLQEKAAAMKKRRAIAKRVEMVQMVLAGIVIFCLCVGFVFFMRLPERCWSRRWHRARSQQSTCKYLITLINTFLI